MFPKSLADFEKNAAAEFARLITDMINAGVLPDYGKYDYHVFGREVAKLAVYGTEGHADAYVDAADFLHRYGAMSGKRELYVASAVLGAAARVIRKKLGEEADA